MMYWIRQIVGPLALIGLGVVFGLLLLPGPPDPAVQITRVLVVPEVVGETTNLRITTGYRNSGCTQTLLTRFLLNTRPTPSIALPQQQGPTALPIGQTEVSETVTLDFQLGVGNWHLFSVASCYLDGDPIPSATVAPTALFDIERR